MSRYSIRWFGTRALLLELATLDEVLALHAQLVAQPLPGQLDVLAAAQTVLLKFDSRRNAVEAHRDVQHLEPAAVDEREGRTVKIEVVYDGDDIETVGELTGLGVDGVIEAHTGQLWRAAFGGFAPGFTYLAGENESLKVPRRDTPRTAVPAGSVALAGNFSAIYPGESPGGWQLIGRSNARMWDLDRDEPALLRPGDLVKYIAIDELSERSCRDNEKNESAGARAKADRAIEVVSPGMQSLIQDLGRPGLGDLGVSASGAADPRAARQANRLVGNAPGDAVIETVLGGLEIRATADLVLARSGAQADARIEGADGRRSASLRAPFRLQEGETLRVESTTAGLRCYSRRAAH